MTFCANYNVNSVNKKVDINRLTSLNIPNFQVVNDHCVRGESLSSRKNRKYLQAVKASGISDIIDLRDKYSSSYYEAMCNEIGLNYHQIPVDASSVDTVELIKKLPELFETLDEKNTYISCAQGLHRTDIALALNYFFNPKSKNTPPIMYGHFRDYGFKVDDIMQRVNSVKKTISKTDLKNLGWDVNTFDENFKTRKKIFVEYNKNLAGKFLL